MDFRVWEGGRSEEEFSLVYCINNLRVDGVVGILEFI